LEFGENEKEKVSLSEDKDSSIRGKETAAYLLCCLKKKGGGKEEVREGEAKVRDLTGRKKKTGWEGRNITFYQGGGG